MLIVSPRNLTGNSAELLPWCLSNLRAIGKKSKARISQPRDPTKSRGGTNTRTAEKGLTYFVWRCLLRLISTDTIINMKWHQKHHVTSAVYNIPSFASISQWACRITSQPGRNWPDASSIKPTPARHRSTTAGPQDSCTGMRVLHYYSNIV